jgi:hypothetical protein
MNADEAMIHYHFVLESGQEFHFKVDRQRQTHPPTPRSSHADWTRLAFYQCTNCPLLDSVHSHCPAAMDVEEIATPFRDMISYERAQVRVSTPERDYAKDCDIQTALRSLLGLVMATSACPILSRLRMLASSHLPFATLQETVFRTVGAYLVKQYFVLKSGGTPDLELRGLERLYQELQTVNRCFKLRLDSACEKEANLNAIGSLLYVSLGVSDSLECNLDELRPVFYP